MSGPKASAVEYAGCRDYNHRMHNMMVRLVKISVTLLLPWTLHAEDLPLPDFCKVSKADMVRPKPATTLAEKVKSTVGDLAFGPLQAGYDSRTMLERRL